MSLASTTTRLVKYVYQHRPSASRRTGAPGEMGGGGYGSGLDPNGRSMHYNGSGLNQPKASRYQISNADTTQTKEPGVATGAEAQPESNYLKLARHLRELQTTPVRDENGRLRSGAAQLRPTQAGTPGQAVGQKLGQFIYGSLVRPKADEEEQRDEEIRKTYGQLSVEGAIEKEKRAQTSQGIEDELRRAQTENAKSMIPYRTEEQRRKAEGDETKALDQRRRVLASVFNKADEFDPEDPANADFVAEARAVKLPLFTKKKGEKAVYRQDAKTGEWYIFRGDQSANVKAPGSDNPLSTTSTSQMSAEQQEENRKSREKIAQWQITSRESIASQNRAMQADRLKLSQQSFAARYPGYGQTLTYAAIQTKAASLKMLVEDVAKQAVAQGYTITEK